MHFLCEAGEVTAHSLTGAGAVAGVDLLHHRVMSLMTRFDAFTSLGSSSMSTPMMAASTVLPDAPAIACRSSV